MNAMQGTIFYLKEMQGSIKNDFESEKYTIILRVFTHLAMMLLVTGRVSDIGISSYNSILSEYIDYLVKTQQAYLNSKAVESIIFYISFLISD